MLSKVRSDYIRLGQVWYCKVRLGHIVRRGQGVPGYDRLRHVMSG
jgi:hypothetical protein